MISIIVNSLSIDKILDLPKLKAFADNSLNDAKIMISLYDREDKIVGKGENAGYQKVSFIGSSSQDCVVRVKVKNIDGKSRKRRLPFSLFPTVFSKSFALYPNKQSFGGILESPCPSVCYEILSGA